MPANKIYSFVNYFKGCCRNFLFVCILLEETEFSYLEELTGLLLVEYSPQRKLP